MFCLRNGSLFEYFDGPFGFTPLVNGPVNFPITPLPNFVQQGVMDTDVFFSELYEALLPDFDGFEHILLSEDEP